MAVVGSSLKEEEEVDEEAMHRTGRSKARIPNERPKGEEQDDGEQEEDEVAPRSRVASWDLV